VDCYVGIQTSKITDISTDKRILSVVKGKELKLPLCLINEDVLGSRGIALPSLISALYGGERSASRRGRFISEETESGDY
jgi:hypothetical protein